jgi:Cu(I)/Ag(I) efflux system membrane fusion protein
MCKTRIENAAKGVKGVMSTSWDDASNTLTYSYNGTVKKEDISNALTKVGHDTELGKADNVVYDKLPGCCKYRK